jgi:GAF domain-containing protein
MDHDGSSTEEVAERLGELLLGDAGVGSVMDFVAHQATLVVPGATEAGVMLVRAGKITSEAQTSDVVKMLDNLQLESDEGPCVVAAREGQVVECPNLGDEQRFPTFAAAAVRSGLHSTLSMPLRLKDRALGSLNVHSGNSGAFTEGSQALVSRLADTAAIVLANAESLHEQAQLADQLRTALETRDAIGMAKGIIMERENVGREQAFEMLVRLSQNQNVKLREIAEQLVTSVEDKFE